MYVSSITLFNSSNYGFHNKNKSRICSYNTAFTAKKQLSISELQQIADLKVFNHHIYEFKKGIRNLILTTEKSKYKDTIQKKLNTEKIDYVIHDVEKDKINVYFGEKPCIDVVKTFDKKLNKLTPEQDFILGVLLGYDKVKQCDRYLRLKTKLKS